MLVNPARQQPLQAAGRVNHRVLRYRGRVRGRAEQPELVEAVVTHIQPDQHQQHATYPVDERQEPTQAVGKCRASRRGADSKDADDQGQSGDVGDVDRDAPDDGTAPRSGSEASCSDRQKRRDGA